MKHKLAYRRPTGLELLQHNTILSRQRTTKQSHPDRRPPQHNSNIADCATSRNSFSDAAATGQSRDKTSQATYLKSKKEWTSKQVKQWRKLMTNY